MENDNRERRSGFTFTFENDSTINSESPRSKNRQEDSRYSDFFFLCFNISIIHVLSSDDHTFQQQSVPELFLRKRDFFALSAIAIFKSRINLRNILKKEAVKQKTTKIVRTVRFPLLRIKGNFFLNVTSIFIKCIIFTSNNQIH